MTNQDSPETPEPSTVLADLERQIKELREKVRLARGTANNIHAPIVDLKVRVEELLSRRPQSQDEVAAALGAPTGRVAEIVKELRPRLRNVGSEDRPAWWLVPGANVTTPELNEAVLALMAYRPVAFKELLDYTGAKPDRVAGALGIAVKTKSVVNAGTQVQARWFLVPTKLGR